MMKKRMNRDRDRDSRRKIDLPKDTVLSYTNSDLLAKFVTEQGAILPRAKTGITQKQQRHLARAVKHARHLALLPFTQTL